METFFVCIFGIIYVISIICSGLYFLKKDYNVKLIYYIAAFTPIWNTYLAYKFFIYDYGSFKEAIKDHFTWGK